MWRLHEYDFSDNWEKTPSLFSSYIGYKQNKVHSDSPTFIDLYTFYGSDEKLLKISERVDIFNVWEDSSYLVLKDSKTQTQGFLFKDDYEFERVDVKFTEKELIISQDSLIQNSSRLSFIQNGVFRRNTQSANIYHFHLVKGGREDHLFQTWSYILTVNISSILFSCCILCEKFQKSFSYNGLTEPTNLLI